MSNDFVHVKGMRELDAVLKTLPAKIEANIMRGAMRQGAKVVAQYAKIKVQKKSTKLARSVRYNTTLDRRVGQVKAYVRAGGKGKKGKTVTAFYANFVEFGTKPHIIKAKPPNTLLAIGVPIVHHPGAKPYPFMRPALDTQAQAAFKAVGDYVRKRLLTQHGIHVAEPDPVEDLTP